MKLSKKLLIGAACAIMIVPVASLAAPISWTSPSIIRAGLGAISSAIVNLTPKGSFIARGQFVCDSVANPNCGLISGLHAMYIPEPSTYTATGGNVKVNNTAKYEAVRTPNAFSGSLVTSRGLRTGSSATLFAVLDIVRNNTGVSYDCVLKDSRVTGTGSAKVSLFDNKSATGTWIYSTPFVKGARDIGSCGTLGTPKANSDVKLYFYSMDTFVGK